jgi:hypothetical protein
MSQIFITKGKVATSRALFLSIILVPAFSMSCGRNARDDYADREVLTEIAFYNPVTKVDGRGFVVELKLEGKHVTDDALIHLGRLSELRSLSLYGADISDEGLYRVQSIQWLDALGIGETPITDKGLLVLHPMKNLRHVWLTERSFSPQSVEKLKQAIPGLTVYLH